MIDKITLKPEQRRLMSDVEVDYTIHKVSSKLNEVIDKLNEVVVKLYGEQVLMEKAIDEYCQVQKRQ